MPILLVIAILLGGSATVSAAAENALPGEALYSVKVNVNEKARAVFSFNEKADAEVDADNAERRMAEFEKLAAEGRLSTEKREELLARFEVHTEKLRARFERLEAAGKAEQAAEVAARFEAALAAHDAIIAKLNANLDTAADGSTTLDVLKLKVGKNLDETSAVRADNEASVKMRVQADVRSAASGKRIAAENSIASAARVVERARAKLGTDADMAVKALAKAQAELNKGNVQFAAKAWNEAFLHFQVAHREAQKARITAQQLLQLELNLNAHVDAESEVNGAAAITDDDEENEENADEDTDDESRDSSINGNVSGEVRAEGSVGNSDNRNNGSVNANVNTNANVNAELQLP